MIRFNRNKQITTQKRAVRIFFIKLFLVVFILHSFFRWTHYRNYTKMTSKVKEVRLSYDDKTNSDPNYRYFKKYEIIKTTKAKGFLIVTTNKEKKYMGTWKQEKPNCNCD